MKQPFSLISALPTVLWSDNTSQSEVFKVQTRHRCATATGSDSDHDKGASDSTAEPPNTLRPPKWMYLIREQLVCLTAAGCCAVRTSVGIIDRLILNGTPKAAELYDLFIHPVMKCGLSSPPQSSLTQRQSSMQTDAVIRPMD